MCQVTLVGKYTIFHLLYLVRTQASKIQTKLIESSIWLRNGHYSIIFVLTESLSLTGHKMFLSLFFEGDSFLSHYKKGIKILFETDVIIILMPGKTPSSALHDSIRQGKANWARSWSSSNRLLDILSCCPILFFNQCWPAFFNTVVVHVTDL